jgi:ATP-dependent Clp protease ATP-binding subunit ClpB
MSLELTDAARELVAREGYEPAFGARPLKRSVQRLIQNPLALRMLEDEIPDGARIRADVSAGGTSLEFTVL